MSEWLGKPKVSKEDIEEYQPTLVKDHPSLVQYYIEDQKFRVTITFPHELFDDFKKVVLREFGEFTADKARRAVEEAIKKWINERED